MSVLSKCMFLYNRTMLQCLVQAIYLPLILAVLADKNTNGRLKINKEKQVLRQHNK